MIAGQANWRKMQQFRFSVEYMENGKVRILVWKILSMSHVPLGRHQEAVLLIRAELHGFELDSNLSPSARRLFESLELFFK